MSPREPQALLAGELAARLERVRDGLGDEAGGIKADAGKDDSAAGAEPCVAVVVRGFEPASFVAGTLEFAHRIPAERRDPWYRAFTRTIFFAGNPATAGERFRFAHVSADHEIGWIGPEPRRALEGLSRMLRLLRAPAPPPAPAGAGVVAGASGDGHDAATLLVATAGLSTERYLVHVNHLLCEAALRGSVRAGDPLRLRHTDEIDPHAVTPSRERGTELRIAPDERDPDRLRVYACLASNAPLAAAADG